MGGTVNATDNFNIPADAKEAVVLDSATPIVEQPAPHVHGPDCGHDHSHEEATAENFGKYTVETLPANINLRASFKNNNDGPLWRKSTQEYLTNLAFHAASVPNGGVRICFVNTEVYKFLLAHPRFHKEFEPSPSMDDVKRGLIGLYNKKIILACDALWEPDQQVTMHKAMYFCDEVLDEVKEVTIETKEPALCEDEGCDHHGTDHVCVNTSEVADDVLDKEKGRCINCLDTGAVAGDPDQVCGCPAGAAAQGA